LGFDYDFTLASYTTHVQRLIYQGGRDHLVERKRYPQDLLFKTEYDKTFAVRGLTFDKERGLLFKLGPNFKVDLTSVFRGRRRLDEAEALAALEGVSHLRAASQSQHLAGILDQFSLAEACLLSDVCEYFYRNKISFSPAAVYQDVSASISHVHVSGLMHRTVMGDVDKYLHHSPKIRQLLTELREAGVETFMLSNSSFDYIDAGMRYLCGDDWMTLFSVVIAEADKPGFFSSRNPFRQLDLSKQTPGALQWAQVTSLRPGAAYSKGNVADLMQLTGWKGNEVLYIGDHVFADLRNPARFHGWWTGAIIRELEKEIAVERTPAYQALLFRMQLVEEIMRRVQWAAPSRAQGSVAALLDELERDRAVLRQRMNEMFNPNFGSVFISSANSPSLFSSSMERYVDIYTSRLENFLDYGPGASYRFYPRRRRTLAHFPTVPSVAKYLEATLERSVNKRDVSLRTELSFRHTDEDDKLDSGPHDPHSLERG
jgi:HAD superfamily 5'-nucleotidase-like hydrolase